MQRFFLIGFFAVAAILAVPETASAQTSYVTDTLRLGLHRAEDTSDRSFRALESGQEMQILSRNRRYALVQLPDGTQGYVKVAYLVDEKPAKLRVAQMQAETESLRAQLEKAVNDYSSSGSRIGALEQSLGERTSELQQAVVSATETKALNASLEERLDAYRGSLPLKFALPGFLVMLVLGFFGGTQWVDYRIRQRHGGFRIY